MGEEFEDRQFHVRLAPPKAMHHYQLLTPLPHNSPLNFQRAQVYVYLIRKRANNQTFQQSVENSHNGLRDHHVQIENPDELLIPSESTLVF